MGTAVAHAGVIWFSIALASTGWPRRSSAWSARVCTSSTCSTAKDTRPWGSNCGQTARRGATQWGWVAPGGLASVKNARLAQAPGLTAHQIREGDRLLVVNGKKGIEETKDELRHSKCIHIHCHRPDSIESTMRMWLPAP